MGEESKNIHNKIYTRYIDNKYIEVSIVTEEYMNPYPKEWNIKYQGIVNEYLGNMPIKNNYNNLLINEHYKYIN